MSHQILKLKNYQKNVKDIGLKMKQKIQIEQKL